MSPTRFSSLALAGLLAAAGCGTSRSTPSELAGSSTFVAGSASGQDVTVENRWCVRCHGSAANATDPATDAAGIAFAPPIDASGSPTGAKVGAHMAHLRAGAIRASVDCVTCHYIPADATSHSPGVHLRGTALARGASPSYASGTCSATYCHGNFAGGNGQVDVSWTGGALTCGTSCHATPPANAAHSGIASNDWAKCAACHGNTVDASGNIKIAGGLHINGKVDGGCTGCHGDVNRADGGIAGVTYDANQTAAPPVETALHSTSTVLVGAHVAHVNPTPSVAGGAQPSGGVYKPLACTECHPDNTTGSHPDNAQAQVTFALATGADLASFVPQFTQGNGTSTPTNCSNYCHNGAGSASATRPTWTSAAATCGSCHAFPPASHTTVTADATKCNACHDGTVNADGSINIAGGLHINGVVDGGESTGGQACGGCHGTIVAGMTGAAVSKHSLTSDDPGFQTTINWVDPLSTVAAANRSCTNMCHGDHPHDLTSPLVATHEYNVYVDANVRSATRDSTTRSKTDFDAAAANGGLCVSCHRFGINGGGPTIDKAAYGASAHDFTAASGSTWQFALHSGSFDRNCTKCHASNAEGRTPTAGAVNSGAVAVHFNLDNATLLSGTTSPIAAGLVCYNCHGSAAPVNGAQGDRSGKNIQAQFAKANNHAVAGSCLACHDPHQAKAGAHATPGNLAGPPLQGASGAQLTGAVAFWTAPAAGDFTAKTIVAGTDVEATLCFKCHSAFGGATDVAKEFNPNNAGNYATTGTTSWENLEKAGSFHPVLAAAGGNLGATSNVKSPWTRTSLMTCSDCHASDQPGDPTGPHGSAAVFLLKGPNTAWSSALVTTSSGMPANTFCINCHEQDFGAASGGARASRFAPNGTLSDGHVKGEHSIACFNCHSAIPHGGPRPGLLVAIKGVRATSPAPPPVIADWDQTAPYYQGTAAVDATKNGLYLKSYPATNATDWSYSNCGCNNTGSH
jgi:predicted CxxxxCH...CXXCH cytochrome family protein